VVRGRLEVEQAAALRRLEPERLEEAQSGSVPGQKEEGEVRKATTAVAIGLVAVVALGSVACGGSEVDEATPEPKVVTVTAAPVEEPNVDTQPEAQPEANAETSAQENARRSAESYLESQSFSRSGLIDQLEYEGFSTADATYAVDAVNPDWNEQAAKSAESYLESQSFSRSGLIDQLEYEGFTKQQAVYGVDRAY
jgi:Host cell surface-exposed lipoprotein